MNVTVTRDNGLWVAVAEGLPEGVVGAMDYEHFSDLHAEFPVFLADLLDRDPGPIGWRYEINGRDVTREIRGLMETTEELRKLEVERERNRKEALAAMSDAGLSQRAMADVVGVSHQRVNQLVKS